MFRGMQTREEFKAVNTLEHSEMCEQGSKHYQERSKRNQHEDIKKALDLAYDFNEKLSQLHPLAKEVIFTITRNL